MKTQIKRFSVKQTAKVVAIVSAVFYVPFAVLFLFAGLATGSIGQIFFALFVPLIYGGIMFLVMAFFCWLYNKVVEKTGSGIEFTLEHKE